MANRTTTTGSRTAGQRGKGAADAAAAAKPERRRKAGGEQDGAAWRKGGGRHGRRVHWGLVPLLGQKDCSQSHFPAQPSIKP